MALQRVSRSARRNAGLGHHPRGAGFTFFETLVVLALVALMALLAIPQFHKIMQRNGVKSTAFEIQTSLLAARMVAVRRNAQINVSVAPTTTPGAPYEIDVELPTPLPGTPTPVPYEQKYFVAANHAEFVTTPTGGVISFGGDGRLAAPAPPQPGIFAVSGPPGIPNANEITIQTDPNGHVTVITPAVWY